MPSRLRYMRSQSCVRHKNLLYRIRHRGSSSRDPQDIDTSSILEGTRGQEKTTTTPPRKIAARKMAKSTKVTQKSRSSECPPLLRYKPIKERVATINYSFSVLVPAEIPLVLEGSTPHIGSLRHIPNAIILENL
ncbi:hypothetical protein J1N35_007592 [Gossypium stocksii]|uniref:Uncharacterized protein n=1 Tax=Gossypium stocksii TaxID=47602 RepID=A0A9D3W6R8_9ROSI|nr:hypothetical protein J1N35_007592 [Gossypium stocksii]